MKAWAIWGVAMCCCLTAILSLLLLLVSPSFAAEKPASTVRIADYLAVFDLEVVGQIEQSLSRPLSDSVRREVVKSGKYKVMERGQMDKILKEQAFQMTGCVAKECAVEAGQLLGAGKVIIGSLGLVGKTYYLSLSQVNVETGETEAVEEEMCKCEADDLIASTKRAARRLMGMAESEAAVTTSGTGTSPAATPTPTSKTYRDPTTGMEFVLIPAGRFLMGSPPSETGRDSGEDPQREVVITHPLYLGKYEVTQAQWRAIMTNNPSKHQNCDDCPVEGVYWNDAQEFLRRLNQRSGTTGYRLPTEAEWEYACRAGSGGTYSFGDDPGRLGEYAWYSDNSGGKTHPVGQKRPNAWGLYDMHGNVYEWCKSTYWMVVRGGSWEDGTWHARRAYPNIRVGPGTNHTNVCTGFRVVLPPQ
ncbi:MAG: SUMF1/EgtB/PvdO family nonheme iron enzyme [bacterium]